MKRFEMKSLLFWVIMLVLFIPLLQEKFHFRKKMGWLMGSYQTAPNARLSASAWFSGEYSSIKEKWLQENFGLRNYYIRLNNQIKWTLFRKAQTHMVVAGKHDYTFEYEYIAG